MLTEFASWYQVHKHWSLMNPRLFIRNITRRGSSVCSRAANFSKNLWVRFGILGGQPSPNALLQSPKTAWSSNKWVLVCVTHLLYPTNYKTLKTDLLACNNCKSPMTCPKWALMQCHLIFSADSATFWGTFHTSTFCPVLLFCQTRRVFQHQLHSALGYSPSLLHGAILHRSHPSSQSE